MSYSKLINDTVRISAKYWWLWIFGFFISLSDAGGTLVQVSKRFSSDSMHFNRLDFLPALALGVMMLALTAAIVYLILKIVAESSLIVAVRNISDGKPASLGPCLSEGIGYFWRLLGLWFVNVILVIGAVVVAAMPVVIAFILHWAIGVISLLIVGPLWLAVMVAIVILFAWAYRIAVIENRGVFSSLGDGWAMLRHSLGQSVAIGLISILSHIVLGIIGLAVIIVVGVPFLIAGTVNLWIGVIPGAITGFCLMVVIYGFTGTYFSSLWTLAYLELRKSGYPAETPSVTV